VEWRSCTNRESSEDYRRIEENITRKGVRGHPADNAG
jgi:hypothetical protein